MNIFLGILGAYLLSYIIVSICVRIQDSLKDPVPDVIVNICMIVPPITFILVTTILICFITRLDLKKFLLFQKK